MNNDIKDITKALLRGEEEFAIRGFISGIKIDRPLQSVDKYGMENFESRLTTVKLEFFFEADEDVALKIMKSVQETNILEHKVCPFLLVKVG